MLRCWFSGKMKQYSKFSATLRSYYMFALGLVHWQYSSIYTLVSPSYFALQNQDSTMDI